MSRLVAENIVKTYGNKNALDGVSLTLESGKIYGLIGRNGAGKTTLLSILTSQNPATSGSVQFDGQPVWENPAVLDQLCFSRELNPMAGNNANTMKVKEYLRIAATFFPYWDKAMAEELVKIFGLDIKKRINKLSKGMMSMVTVIVALASKAPFTFLDEPVAGLDVVAREQFYRILIDEFTETGRTFVISTHIIEEAADIMEEVIIIKKGELLCKENTQDLLDRAYRVSGLAETVDEVTSGFECYHPEKMGRSKAITVLLQEGQTIPQNPDVTIQPVNLQNLFVALCGIE